MIAKKVGVPALLWAPRDEAPLADGSRLRDSLCGMFATSKVLHKLKVPFTYIENCRIGEDIFKNGLLDFVRSATVVKALKTMKLAQIGVRIDFFWTTIINESELLDRFGIEVLPVDMYDFIEKIRSRAKKDRKNLQKELAGIKKWLDVQGLSSDEPLLNTLALRDELIELAHSEDLDAISIKSFTSLQDALEGGCGLAYSQISDDFPIIEESDIHGAVTSVILEAASHNDLPSFFPDITIRHPENDNAVLLWHASAPLSLKHPDSKIKMAPPWILKGLPAVSLHFRLMDGPLTLARFDGDHGRYRLGCGEGHTVPGPHTNEFYAWMEVGDWPHWEKTIMQGPYIHHSSVVYDHCAGVLEEACKYIPDLDIERFDKKQS
jgi:L-fucose isomerase-like protein